MNGPPNIAGFLTAATWILGARTYDSMILMCRSTIFIAVVAGGIRWGQAYQWSTSGSMTTFCRKYSKSVDMRYPLVQFIQCARACVLEQLAREFSHYYPRAPVLPFAA